MGFADGLHVSSHGPDGNRAAVDVVLDDQEADSLADGEVLADDVARATPADAERLEVRAMRPDDAAGLSRCVYRCYGYSYVDPMLYRPRQVRRAMRSGLVDSVVAVTPDGEVVGHCALTYERHGDPVPEAGKLVVDPRYRGHHLSERMAAVRKQEAVDAELAGFWSECVTNHPFSQREVAGTGGSETGLLIGAAPAAVTMAGLDNRTEGRHALITMYVPVLDRGPSTLHVPEHHVGLLGTLVDGLGLSRRVVGGTGPATGRSSVSVSVSAPSGVAHLRVAVVGADLVERVADHLEGLQAFDLAVVHLDLPIDGPAAAGAVQDLERLGFCWGAWMPAYSDRGDVLRLQRVGDRPVVTDHVQVAGPRGEAVRDHVLAEWRRVHRGIAP